MLKNKTAIFFSFIGILFFISLTSLTNFAEQEPTLREIADISYYQNGEVDSDLTKLNLIIPEGVEDPPVFIWIGGGAWAYVNRNKEMPLCREMAKQGILMISVGHRLSPALLFPPTNTEGIHHPEHIKDITRAFKWVYDNAEEYGYSKKNIFLGGFSSGAYLAALLAADQQYLKEVGLSIEHIKAIVPVGGAYDMEHYKNYLINADPTMLEKHIVPVFGKDPDILKSASPINFLDQFNTPMLMISESDTYPYAQVFEKALEKKGQKNYQAIHYQNETHGSLWKKLSQQSNNPYRDQIVSYIKSNID